MSEYYEREYEAAKREGFPIPAAAPAAVKEGPHDDRPLSENREAFRELCSRKKADGETGYIVSTNISQDDDMDEELSYLFREPRPASYDRYVKTSSTSQTKAMKAFVLDNVCSEQREDLRTKLDEWPALGISLGEKLLYMLGLSKTTTVKRL